MPTLVASLGLMLAACVSEPEKPTSVEVGEVVQGFAGGVAADEPRAALVAQEVLARQGTAADAAVALGFALSVTYPVAAGLGGGGMCVVHDAATDSVETLEFLPRMPIAGGLVAVPGLVRGLAALHSSFGRIEWGRLVSPAEALARRGHPASRALTRRLAAVRAKIDSHPGLASRFVDAGGQALEEGRDFVQVELSALLAQIRVRGPGEFYVGQAAITLVNGAREAGGTLTLADLRAYRPSWRKSVSGRLGEFYLHATPAPMTGGIIAGQILTMVSDDGRYAKTPDELRPHLLAEASQRAYIDRDGAAARPLSAFRANALMSSYRADRHTTASMPGLLPASLDAGPDGTTSFAVVDREGSAVACVLTMGSELGDGAVARGSGVVLAPPPDGADLAYLGPLLVLDDAGKEVILVATASGGVGGPAALAQTALVAVGARESLSAAIDGGRISHPGRPDVTLIEPDMMAAAESLRQRGHQLRERASRARINAIHCPGGLQSAGSACVFRADHRGFGLALGGAL
ncbi:MAG TPA: gamma-glutamyltransferase [Alphaproteobacteria bacterium]|nr:gamma-glutamyltransferase [Alphaproteobacteria bacterium]HJM49359.1 gamma-glutamyltransferase [Alphaproteobacteria bacterium]